jgi:hypothetical protein
MDEKRAVQRHRTLKGGSIAYSAGAGVDCIVRNLSTTGASLEVASPIGIPGDFKLIIKPENVTHNCRVVWRTAKKIGVHFV